MKTGLSETFTETYTSLEQTWDSATGSDDVTAPENEETVTLSRRAVKRVQAQLTRLGFRPGPADGLLGSKTTRAIKSYQTAHQMPITGNISSQFLKHLEVTSAGGSADNVLVTSPY